MQPVRGRTRKGTLERLVETVLRVCAHTKGPNHSLSPAQVGRRETREGMKPTREPRHRVCGVSLAIRRIVWLIEVT